MGGVGGMVGQLRRLWSGLGRTRQLAIGGIGVGAIVFAVIFLNMGAPQQYVVAFTNLDPKDSNAIVEALKADAIPYQVSPDGGTVKVAPERLADARLKLASKGLPQGGAVGFELFDKTSFGVTDFVQNINYQRALEGELTRTINTLAQVEGSRVHIVVPKQELFVQQQKPATASVLLRLRPGRTLDDGALKGIAHMVARSVEGLAEKNITILDSGGRMLFDGGTLAESGVAMTGTQMETQKKFEKGVEGELQSLLDRVAGPGRAAVRVRADMDFSQQEELSETFNRGGADGQGVPRSSATTQETFSGANGSAQQPGAAQNLPGRAGQVSQNNPASTYQRTETTTNYEVGKTTQRTTRGPGSLKRLSISVLLDSSIPEADAAGLRDAVAAAAGLDQKRGDQIVVTTATFNNQPAGESIPAAKPVGTDMLTKYGSILVPVVAAILVLLVVWRMSRSVQPRRPKVKVQELGAMSGQLALAGAGAGAGALAAAQAYGALPAGEGYAALPDPSRRGDTPEQAARRQEVQERMQTLAQANPDAVVEIIHSWMAQDDRKK